MRASFEPANDSTHYRNVFIQSAQVVVIDMLDTRIVKKREVNVFLSADFLQFLDWQERHGPAQQCCSRELTIGEVEIDRGHVWRTSAKYARICSSLHI